MEQIVLFELMSQGFSEEEVDAMSVPASLTLTVLGPIKRQKELEAMADAVALGICKAFGEG